MLITRAPGKLILLGEYAVLAGEPALVAAVERHVDCAYTPGAGLTVEAGAHGALRRTAGGFAGAPLPFVRALIDADTPDGVYRLDSSALSAAAGGEKLGLGSSAAASVAFAAAADAAAGRTLDAAAIYARAQAAHRRVQGTGSGADVAASTFGGLLAYRWWDHAAAAPPAAIRAGDGAASVRPLPAGDLRLLCAWTGRPASTPALVGRVEAFGEARPAEHRALMERLGAQARAGIDALGAGDRRGLCAAAAATAASLEALGAAAGAPIVTDAHRALAAIAQRFGAVAKPTGAGGGDLAWLITADADHEAALAKAAAEAGFPVHLLRVDPDGVRASTGAA